MVMTETDQEVQMVRAINECEERTRIKKELEEKYAEMSQLLTKQRLLTTRLLESFAELKEILKK